VGLVVSPTSSPSAGSVSVLAAGDAHTCVVDAAQLVRCTGANESDQLGVDGPDTCTISSVSTECSRGFLSTTLGTGVSALAIGSTHGCLLASGAVSCWGDNTYGQLGVTGAGTSLAALRALGP
jgi:alpha-tubulin suppressor-like RCC1 family protein